MKFRNGFVSNSSSSSFIIVTTTDYDYNNEIEDEDLKKLYSIAFHPRVGKFNGQDIYIYKGWADTSDGENTIYDSLAFTDYCDSKDISDDDACEVAEQLYFNFTDYFDKNCLVLSEEE